jgi:hypothetical protein
MIDGVAHARFQHRPFSFIQSLLSLYSRISDLPNVAIALIIWDEPRGNHYDYFPWFCMQSATSFSDISIPDDPIFDIFHKYSVSPAGTFNDWYNHISKAVWRGGTSGGHHYASVWPSKPRIRLSRLSKDHLDLIDAALVGGVHQQNHLSNHNMVTQEIFENARYSDRISMEDQAHQYRYLIHADGNGWADRFPLLLKTGVPVLKQHSEYHQWWYWSLKPWIHYIPVDHFFQDLPQQVRWANEHPEEAYKIGQNARQFMLNRMRMDDVLCYMARLINWYGSKFRGPIQSASVHTNTVFRCEC